ncbi:hypothetical protein [Nocardia sp. NBC_01377]|uniref:hypothetical protein n=1 Tax=Nocardia sp. NBC_01377 TaxID=2903595 RepID=UPI003870ACD0
MSAHGTEAGENQGGASRPSTSDKAGSKAGGSVGSGKGTRPTPSVMPRKKPV